MGQAGSYTNKAKINKNLFSFTKWNSQMIQGFMNRGIRELSDVFGLRKNEFEFVLGRQLVDFQTIRELFELFDSDGNGVIDKFELMCVICLTSKISNEEKISFLFEMFNFNEKGYLLESEISLLIQSVTRGIFKVDQQYIPPTRSKVITLVKEILSYSIVYNQTIRRPELFQFASESKLVLSFLESWRGHSSQATLGINEKWRDLSFPSNINSIQPNRAWSTIGLPPAFIVKWRRLNKVGTTTLGCPYLFNHEVSFLKTVDRRSIYKGPGVIGSGFLNQGLLADRWLLNAVAAMIVKPYLIQACFAETGQESAGRYCTRLYEGGSWQSIYVDDRIPCAPDCRPLFASSSSDVEAWPMIIEKGFAKYFGSYGHIGNGSLIHDSTLTALRLLTGGHVIKYYIKDYDWCTLESDASIGKFAFGYIRKWFLEGSLITFCRSESSAFIDSHKEYHSNRFQPRKTDDDGIDNTKQSYKVPPIQPSEIPYGRIFPYVGSEVIDGYNYLILRDAWNLGPECRMEVDVNSGHSRTFLVKINTIPSLFDTMIIARFPDALRPVAEAQRLRPWVTSIVDQYTFGPDEPAIFELRVEDGDPEVSNQLQLQAERISKSRPKTNQVNVQKVLEDADQLDDVDPTNQDNLSKNKSRDHERKDEGERFQLVPSASKRFSIQSVISSLGGDEGMKSRRGSELSLPSHRSSHSARRKLKSSGKKLFFQGDITFTVSSSLKWIVGGAKENGAKLRVRVIPTTKTLISLINQAREVEQEAKRQEILRKNQKVSEEQITSRRVSISSNSNPLEEEKEKFINESSHSGRPSIRSFGSGIRPVSPGTTKRKAFHKSSSEDQIDSGFYNIRKNSIKSSGSRPMSAERSPGSNVIDSQSMPDSTLGGNNVESNDKKASSQRSADRQSYQKQFEISLSAERTWISHTVSLFPGEYYILADVSYKIAFDEAYKLSIGEESGDPFWTVGSRSKNTVKKLFTSGLIDNNRATIASVNSKKSVDLQSNLLNDEKSLSVSMDSSSHRIWLQVSSHDKFNLQAHKSGQKLESRTETSLENIVVEKDNGPLLGESQRDTSIHGIYKMLKQYSEEINNSQANLLKISQSITQDQKKLNVANVRHLT